MLIEDEFCHRNSIFILIDFYLSLLRGTYYLNAVASPSIVGVFV